MDVHNESAYCIGCICISLTSQYGLVSVSPVLISDAVSIYRESGQKNDLLPSMWAPC